MESTYPEAMRDEAQVHLRTATFVQRLHRSELCTQVDATRPQCRLTEWIGPLDPTTQLLARSARRSRRHARLRSP